MHEEYEDCEIAYNFSHLVLAFYLTLLCTLLSVHVIYTNKQKVAVSVINTEKECIGVCEKIEKHCRDFTAVGFDAEWVSDSGRVALVQICTAGRRCALFRLNKLSTVPDCLRKILEDEKIIKLGVGTVHDAQRLYRDFSIEVRGSLDLRLLWNTQHGLARLAFDVLGVSLDKEMQCSDWESEKLSQRQIHYAMMDTLVSVEMFKQWIGMNFGYGDFIWEVILERISGYLDKSAGAPKPRKTQKTHKTPEIYKVPNTNFCQKGEIYSQCFMRAPDDTLLCTCSKDKAMWYLKHNRAEIVTEQPLTIRLLFEPKKKPTGSEHRFPTELKQDQCVVCASKNHLVKYWVVPKTITKYFPTHLKSHCSHDVIVLCLTCHQKADYFRRALMTFLEPELRANDQFFGKSLIERYTDTGKTLHNLQREFRENFVYNMKPNHLPLNWSIDHVN